VFEQEGFLVTFKVYSLENFSITGLKYPEFEGFLVQEVLGSVHLPDQPIVRDRPARRRCLRLLLTRLIRRKHSITGLKYPEFEGFLVQEVELPQEKQLTLENYNGP